MTARKIQRKNAGKGRETDEVTQPRWRKLPRYALDKAFYDRLRSMTTHLKPVERLVVAPYSGRGFTVKKGQTFRFITPEGPQIGDVALWNEHNSREFMSATRTWVLEGFVIRPDVRLWSDVPYLRPMATCIRDTVIPRPINSKFHHHDCRTHCTSEQYEMRTGRAGLNSCHLNFLQAIGPFGLSESDIHDNFMVHQKTYVEPKRGRLYVVKGDSKPGDFIEFYAELDLLIALSVCPMGDGSGGGPDEYVVRPLAVEIYDTGITPLMFPTWTDWRADWRGEWRPQEGDSDPLPVTVDLDGNAEPDPPSGAQGTSANLGGLVRWHRLGELGRQVQYECSQKSCISAK